MNTTMYFIYRTRITDCDLFAITALPMNFAPSSPKSLFPMLEKREQQRYLCMHLGHDQQTHIGELNIIN